MVIPCSCDAIFEFLEHIVNAVGTFCDCYNFVYRAQLYSLSSLLRLVYCKDLPDSVSKIKPTIYANYTKYTSLEGPNKDRGQFVKTLRDIFNRTIRYRKIMK